MHLMKRAAVLVMVAGIAAAAGWACDDEGNALTLEEYFQRIEEADSEANERSDEVFETEPETVEEAQDQLQDLPDIIRDFIEDLENIEPPEEAQDAHERVVEGGREAADQFEDIIDEASDAESIEDFFAALSSDEFANVGQAFDDACQELQALADENEIDVTLNCGEA